MRPPFLIFKFNPFQKLPLRGWFVMAFVFAVSVTPSVFAKTLTIEDAERMAVESSLEVRLAHADVKIRDGLRKEATASYYPNIYSRIIAPFVGRESGFFADQIIWDFGRTKNRVKSSKNLITAAEFSKQHAINEVVLRVRNAFHKVLLEQARLIYAEKNRKLARLRLERSRILEKNGRISPLELAQQESDEQSAVFEAGGVRNQVESARFALFQLVGVRDGSGIIFESPADRRDLKLDEKDILPDLFKSNSYLLSLEERLKSDKANIAAAKAEFLPVVYGRVAYRFEGEGAETPAFIAGAGATIPIFQGFSRFAALDRVRAESERTEIQIALEKQRLEREIKRLLLDISHAEAEIKLSRQILGTAEKRLILAREKESLGVISNLDLVFSEKEYAKFYLKYEESLYTKRVLVGQLSFVAGEISAEDSTTGKGVGK